MSRPKSNKVCKICGNRALARELCSRHYEAQRVRKPAGPPCSVCQKPSVARGLCDKHYRRIQRTGTIESSSYGTHGKHPLYGRWRWTSRTSEGRDPSWESFEQFVEDVGEPPHPKSRLERIDTSLPFGPDNFTWGEYLEIVESSRGDRNAYSREWTKKRPHLAKNNLLKKMYGISLGDYESMLESQKGVCAICGEGETKIIKGNL